MREYQCPNCGSDQIQKASGVVAAGTSNLSAMAHTSGTTTFRGVGLSGGRLGVGVGTGVHNLTTSTAGVQVTDLARQLVPPAKPTPPSIIQPVWMAFMVAAGVYCVSWLTLAINRDYKQQETSNIVWSVFLGVTAAVSIWKPYTAWVDRVRARTGERIEAWKSEYAEWEKLWYCHRCTHSFRFRGDEGVKR